ncbi:MAG: polysaccharide deacetylase family protein, partial [Elusimicrobiales bacterium]|nr:polysaccharide deacetylase family protein [Elusimicrobiales bacterium]
KDPLPEKAVLITFDDGYQNNYTVAYPILKEFGAKGNIFLVFNTIGKVNSWHNPASEPWVNMCTLDQLKEMQESGVFDFGGHTLNHPHLTKIDHEDAKTEINQSKKKIEEALGRELCAFAYPYGDGAYNEGVRKIALDAGYTFDFSFKEGITAWPWERDNHTIDRLYIKGSDDMGDFRLHLKKGNIRII